MEQENNFTELMAEIREGNQEAFSKVWEKMNPLFVGILKKRYPGLLDYEEILQDTALRIWTKKRLYQDFGNEYQAKGWLITI